MIDAEADAEPIAAMVGDHVPIVELAVDLAGPVGVPTLLGEAGFKVERMDRSVAPAAPATRPNKRR